MFSKEFMKFIYEYQKEDFSSNEPEKQEIYFNNNRGGKPAEVLLTEKVNN